MATVNFTLDELVEAFEENEWGDEQHSRSTIQGFYDSMLGASRRRAHEVMDRANELMDGHGIELIRRDSSGSDDDPTGVYVNMGDTYNATILYEEGNNSFHLTNWGDWLQQQEQAQAEEWQAELDELEEPEERDEPGERVGRFFKVRISHYMGHTIPTKAYWHDSGPHLGAESRAELTVLLPHNETAETSGVHLWNGETVLHRATVGRWIATSWRLDSVDAALVEMDVFLEGS